MAVWNFAHKGRRLQGFPFSFSTFPPTILVFVRPAGHVPKSVGHTQKLSESPAVMTIFVITATGTQTKKNPPTWFSLCRYDRAGSLPLLLNLELPIMTGVEAKDGTNTVLG